MPTVAVDKADLFERLGRNYTTEEFDHLCFEFGIELDEDTTEEVEENIKKGLPAERPQLKIEVGANRYDLLCLEGISRALRIFLQLQKPPVYKYRKFGPGEKMITATVAPDCARVRPFFAGAVLRNLHFTQRSYDSFIDLQDKLHQNICRRRSLVAIGTHDLDTIVAPFSYEALPQNEIKFVPLNKSQAYTCEELMELYKSDKHLSRYLHITKDLPVHPIIYDTKRQVLSMPPIINSEHSKITLNTRNVFIDVTATDETKLNIVVNMVATMFSEYCSEPFTIEPVQIIYPDERTKITPELTPHKMVAHASYINACTGLSITAKKAATLIERMSLHTSLSPNSSDEILVDVPATRPDILHECDIMEDAAVAYGFNNLKKTFPSTSTVAQPLAIGRLCDIVRRECAQAGWIEVLPLILCSHDENFAWMNRKDDGKTAVRLANPKTLEYQVIRTSLLPGILKTVRENKAHALPIRVFETSDVVIQDLSRESQTRNIRNMGAVWCNKTAGFEIVHGLLDRIMAILEIPRIHEKESTDFGYYIKETQNPTFFLGRAATIHYRPKPASSHQAVNSSMAAALAEPAVSKGGTSVPLYTLHAQQANSLSTVDTLKTALSSIAPSVNDIQLGMLGILHPTVLQKFEIDFPCSALELNLEPFKKESLNVWGQ
ncbi:phenylalanyl-tRNA synthetase subunit beta [Dacryopinax primogenitus]|uniref:Phenylalanine--tRNA ligase beta subunit n=1 Tax=Dacryopinax primogenitus (strain DJM 731) TaxID=1858805 RepID=M5GH04_DACPD|nr:phenylalanyl-tRNA synthetase subunit beta [Dacryopinax primogenitus]EJU06393.1 phenylalanyl-tRNA synthetase subunit beta [Dacryopinax primogenitus]